MLSGGAACGLANIGVLDVLVRHGLTPQCVAGSSMGAIVAALYALGHPPAVMIEMAARLKPLRVVGLSARPWRDGLHRGLLVQRLEQYLAPLIGDARIGHCKIPFVCVAGRVCKPIRWQRMLRADFVDDLRQRVQLHVFSDEVKVMDAIRASSAIPVVFSPALVNGEEFVDLVHFGAIPARTLRQRCAPEILIATDTQPSYEQIEPFLPNALRAFLHAGREETALSIAACDHVIRPKLPASMLRFDLSDAFVAAGVDAANACLAELQALLCLSTK